MRSTTTLLQALFASSALAIQITNPKKNDVVDPSSGVEVKWSTVSTDPKSAHLVLVNMASGHTPYTKDLGAVDLTKGSVIISEKDVPNDSDFQFNFQSVDPLNQGILAQSEQFEVKNSDDDKKETTKSAAATTTAAATLVTASDSAAATATSGAASSDEESSSSAAASMSGASTLATVTGSATVTASGTASATHAPTAAAGKVESGSLLALAVGLVAVLA
ncbi:anchored cell wall protein 3 [Neurospora crassa OR74A]|uniref:Anchored cell wall protein 3 n=1 Tax=Neurospora crassa (strain ATCC 24698 / 74-OR23-1A / CBS 708.71 / DSM 1257 / FGSC 987) TaxID=367110 RepID=Q7SAW7_NEUCR|nr:anchored cell wall protein 3 [Neurospora crassa OR74A]EAA33536.1 anchored cell wall protein 3 [Neurospora crassa OR74A]|eukprot:XP_962772.1 anchored cell wall protein 3 [Neurospora crassa OR74A]